MIRYGFALIILLHGMIHLMGFSKAFGYTNIQQLTKELSKPAGICWLLAAILFIITAILYFLKNDYCWMVTLPAILLSQVLIIMYWKDAKFGTIANAIILLTCIVGYAEWHFNKTVKVEVTALLGSAKEHKAVVTNEMIVGLPPVVQKWMKHSGVMGKQMTSTVRLKQKGQMQLKQGSKWMDFNSTQYFSTGEPAFNWQVKVNMMPLVYIDGRDKYEQGRGEMLIRLLSLKKMAYSKGSAETDQGTLLRYLSETCWFPTAALSSYIKWDIIDDRSAKATMSYDGITASGIFFFNEAGDVTGFEAMRYGDFDGKQSLEKWYIESKEYKEFEGIRIPSKSEVTWKLKNGDFTWLKLELLTVEYNKQKIFN